LVLTLTHPSDATLRTARRTIGDGLKACMGGPIESRAMLLSVQHCLLKKKSLHDAFAFVPVLQKS
jgi:hypothetical protein